MRMIIIGDIHLADRPPSARTETYLDDMLEKLDWIVEYANDVQVDAILSLGDVFHIKRPDHNSHNMVTRTADIFGKSNSPVRIIQGNHDQTHDDYATIHRQPLGTLALHPNIDIVTGPDKDFPIFGVPYVDPTPENLEFWADLYHKAGGPGKYPIVPTHQAIFPAEEAPLYPFVAAEEWASNFESKYTPYGHIHSIMKAGPFYERGGTMFCNRGAISRGSLHEETIHRKLYVTEFDDSNEEEPYKSVPIPFKSPDEVFNLETVQLEKEQQVRVKDFLDSLGNTELSYLTTEKLVEDARRNSMLHKESVDELEEIITSV